MSKPNLVIVIVSVPKLKEIIFAAALGRHWLTKKKFLGVFFSVHCDRGMGKPYNV